MFGLMLEKERLYMKESKVLTLPKYLYGAFGFMVE